MSGLLLLLVILPFVTAGTTLVVGHTSETATRGITLGGSAIGLGLASAVAAAHLGDAAPLGHVYASTTAAGPAIELSLYVDQLSAVMLLLAHGVSFLVQVYSLGYLADDPRYPSYAALVAVFTGAMTTVVVADDLWVLLIGWELMGMCSYFLIGHYWELPEARAGAVKAFLMTRTADLGLLFAILVLGNRFGSYRISTVMDTIADGSFGRDALWLPALLVAVAVIGKSAQFPFHTWLPDAMPGPTPISALIHAATMVAAGVFLVARTYPLFLSSPSAMDLLAVVATVTMVTSAVYALFSHDLKRVLAWSTVSQLAYMFGALSVGASTAAVLHLLAHGAFKALLFLGAGSVMHAVGGASSMEQMGGLREKLPDTFATMTLGFGALAGVVPLVGFFTKDAVVGGVLEEARDGRLVWPWLAWVLLVAMLVTVVLTVAYSLRAWLLTFFGAPRVERPATEGPSTGEAPVPVPPVAPHESPAVMRLPLYLLAIPTTLGGLVIAYPTQVLGPDAQSHLVHAPLAVATTLLVLVTGAAVVWRWARRPGWDLWRPMLVPHPQVDRVYDLGVVRPTRFLSVLVRANDRDVIDAYADGTGATVRGLGWLLRRAQNGNVQAYLMVVVVGAAAVAVAAGALS